MRLEDCIPYGGRPCKDLTGRAVGNATIVGYLGKITADVGNEYWLVQCNNCYAMRPVRADYLFNAKRRMLHCREKGCGPKFREFLREKRLTKNRFRYLYLKEKKTVDTSCVEAHSI